MLLDATSHEASREMGAVHAQIHAENLSSGKLDDLCKQIHPCQCWARQANDEWVAQKAFVMHGLQGKRNEKSGNQADMGR